jgi:uncharacterized protein (DUF1800 family)
MKRLLKSINLIWFLGPIVLLSQEVTVFGGLGKSPKQIIASDQARVVPEIEDGSADKVMNGSGMDEGWYVMGRLMRQATLGVNKEDMEEYSGMTPESWIDMQMAYPKIDFLRYADSIMPLRRQLAEKLNPDNFFPFPIHRYSGYEFKPVWWLYAMTEKDHLRMKMMYVLSQIFVISDATSDLSGGRGLASYTKLLYDHAFGNFYDLLLGVSLHPAMGAYLTHLNNPKANPALNIFPDENYAREVMQLFSIGLHELHPDGTFKLDSLGNTIPTYNQTHIKELARVFTGLSASKRCDYDDPLCKNLNSQPWFGISSYQIDYAYQMRMYEEHHDRDVKIILSNVRIPPFQPGMEDIKMAIRTLVDHPNTPPFICKQLIQKFVTSNPGPQYVKDIADVFVNNGSGVRGDLGAVVKAMLLHPEARSCEIMSSPTHGKLQEPFIRYMDLMHSIDLIPDQDKNILYNGHRLEGEIKVDIFYASTVFNFYRPDYQPLGEIRDRGLYGPEFQLHDSKNSINLMSVFDEMTGGNRPLQLPWAYNIPWQYNYYLADYSKYMPYQYDSIALINYINKRLAKGSLSKSTIKILSQFSSEIGSHLYASRLKNINSSLFLTAISADYSIVK